MAAHELTCVVHVHSAHSDGTGTIDEIAAAAKAAAADAVLVTDHDTMAGARQAGWHDGVLVVVGTEITPSHGSHLLAFGLPRTVRHLGRPLSGVVDAIHAAGGIGFAAHPFSRGGWMLGLAGRSAAFGDLRLPIDGIELWSLATDTLEQVRSPWRLARLGLDPDAVLDDPPAGNLAAWDALGAGRRLPAIAGLDAHQHQLRRRGRVWLQPMSYARTFALLRTHALVDLAGADVGDAGATTAALLSALAAGHAFLARDSLADATGFRFATGDGALTMGDESGFSAPVELVVRSPQPARLCLLRDGTPIASADDARELRAPADRPGVYRVSAHLRHRRRWRTWVLSNPIYLRRR